MFMYDFPCTLFPPFITNLIAIYQMLYANEGAHSQGQLLPYGMIDFTVQR